MIKRRVVAVCLIVLLFAGALAYHLLVGFVETTGINEKITVLTRRNVVDQIGANVVLYTDPDETFVVDTQLAPLGSLTRSKIDALAQTPISKVVITHWHPDHSGGISAFSADVDVVAHENVRRRLAAPQEGFGLTKPGSHHEFPARAPNGLPTQTVPNGSLGSSSAISLEHYPNAHTDGDLVVYFHDLQVAVIGDLVWPGSFPYVDVHNGGTVEGLESALRAVLRNSKPGYRFIPGHGPALTFHELEKYVELVGQSRGWVETRLQDGQTVEHIAAAGLPADWDKWSSALVPSAAWIEMIIGSRAVTMPSKQ